MQTIEKLYRYIEFIQQTFKSWFITHSLELKIFYHSKGRGSLLKWIIISFNFLFISYFPLFRSDIQSTYFYLVIFILFNVAKTYLNLLIFVFIIISILYIYIYIYIYIMHYFCIAVCVLLICSWATLFSQSADFQEIDV